VTSTGRNKGSEHAGGVTEGERLPVFRRARPQDALDVATATFQRDERVDMGALAAHLDISRATLYRWFGSRDQLIERLLVQLAGEFGEAARANTEGKGDERVIDFARRLMTTTVDYRPLRTFVEREPQLALRLLISARGAVHASVLEQLLAVVAETHSLEEAKALEPHLSMVTQVGATLQWATLAVGDEPGIERAVDIVRGLLAAGRATTA
jgi:AcrR family transcriptional regulator